MMTPRQEAAAKLGEAFMDLTEALRMNQPVETLETLYSDVDRAKSLLEQERTYEAILQFN
jgi:hypothetical protein